MEEHAQGNEVWFFSSPYSCIYVFEYVRVDVCMGMGLCIGTASIFSLLVQI